MSTLPLRMILAAGFAPLVAALGAAEAVRVRREARVQLSSLLMQLPDFGPRGGARYFVTGACWLVAFHRALPGRDAETNTALFRACLLHGARLIPAPVRWLYRTMYFNPSFQRKLFASTVGGGPEGFAGELLQRGPDAFGVDYTRCGIQHFLVKVEATDLAAHVCSLDDVESEVFGLGLTRNGTLGRGASTCDFRWSRQ